MKAALTALCLVVLAGGCVGLTGPDEPVPTQSIHVTAQNDANESYVVRVTALSGPIAGYELTYPNGTTRSVDATGVPGSIGHARDVRARGPDAVTRSHRLAPNTGFGTSFEDRPRNATLVYVVRQPDASEPLRSWGTSRCLDADRFEVSIRIYPDGHQATATTCTDETTTTATADA